MELDNLYQEIILDHYKQPRNQGHIENADLILEGKNPFCGDEIKISVTLKNDLVDQVSFEGNGCAISQASASVMTEKIKGKTIDEAEKLVEDFSHMVKGEDMPIDLDDLDDMAAFQGVSEFPTRVKCALLAWKTLKRGIHDRQECLNCEKQGQKSE